MSWEEMMTAVDDAAATAFGSPVTYRPAAGGEAVFLAVFDETPVFGRFDDDGEVAGRAVSSVVSTLSLRRSVFLAAFVGLLSPEEGDFIALIYGGEARSYRISDVQPDGASWRLTLQRVRERGTP